MLFNLILIAAIAAGISIVLFMNLKNSDKKVELTHTYTIDGLIKVVDKYFTEVINRDYRELNLNQAETDKREAIKKLIRRYLKECISGDEGAKEYIKDYIKEIIITKGGINTETVNKVIAFEDSSSLTAQDKFEILLFLYKKKYGKDGLQRLFEKHFKTLENNTISAEDVARIYDREFIDLSFEEKTDILSQRVYQEYRGFGVIDGVREMKIDGMSAGVSSYGSIPGQKKGSLLDSWIFYHGQTILLDFLKFPSEKELIRVCKNIYRNNNPGLLSETRGYLVNDMKDGSRVVVFRPPVACSWAFFVRKHDMITEMDIRRIICEEGGELLIQLLKWMVGGCMSIVITGEMGSGKTTLLKLLIQFIEEKYPIRVYEQVSELNLNKAYPGRNILSLRESPSVTGQEILNIMKKTDGTVLIIGEVASHEAANYLVEIAQISRMTLCSHHGETTQDFISYLKIAQLKTGGFSNEALAEYQAVNAVSIDIHMENRNGHRFISRITEIIPCHQVEMSGNLSDATREYYERRTSPVTYNTRDIISFQEGKYVFQSEFSQKTHRHIYHNLADKEREEYLKFLSSQREVRA